MLKNDIAKSYNRSKIFILYVIYIFDQKLKFILIELLKQ